MANTIVLKRSATSAKVPTTSQLSLGEIAINTYDGLLYIKKDNGTASIVQVGGVTSVNSETGAVTLTTDDISDSSQTNKWASAANVRTHLSGTGAISYSSSTGVITTTQNLTTAGTPAFAGMTLTANVDMSSNKIVSLGAPTSGNDATTKTYVDAAIDNISTSSITQGNSNVTVTDTGTGTVTVSVDGSTALTVNASGVTVAGNFTVSGTTTTVNSNTIDLADNILTLNSDASGAASQNAGIEVERGDDTNVSVRWNEGSDIWQFTNDGTTYYPMAVNTDDLAVGSTNLYHTTALARATLSAGSGISYSSSTGVITASAVPNASLTNSAVTVGTTSISLGASSTTLAGLSSVTSTAFVGALTGNATTATALATARTINISGDLDWTSLAFDGSGSVSSAGTLATVNSNVGSFTYGSFTVNAKGLVTAASSGTAPVTSVVGGSYLTGGTITSTGTLAVDATTTNTASKIVARDGSGNFSAGTITATLSGAATTAGTVTTAAQSAITSVGTLTSLTVSGATATGALTVSGGITATGEITAYYSDERLKTNVSKIHGALAKVMAINGYTYDSSELAESLGLPKHMDQIGLMAQEVEAVMPELVTQSGIAGYKTIRYDKVVSVLVNAIKEQQAMIDELRQMVKGSIVLH